VLLSHYRIGEAVSHPIVVPSDSESDEHEDDIKPELGMGDDSRWKHIRFTVSRL